MSSEFFDINQLIEDIRNGGNLFVVFSQRGAGKSAVTKLITAVEYKLLTQEIKGKEK